MAYGQQLGGVDGKPDRQTVRLAGVATVLAAVLVLTRLVSSYVFPFFDDLDGLDVRLDSLSGAAGSTVVLVVAVTALVASRLRRLPLVLAAAMVSVATALVPATVVGAMVSFRFGTWPALASALTIVVAGLVCGQVVLVRPLRAVVTGILAAAIVGLCVRFLGTLMSRIVLHYIDGPSVTIGVILIIAEEIVFGTVVVASLVPGLVHSGAVAGSERLAGLTVGVVTSGVGVVASSLSCLTLLGLNFAGYPDILIDFVGFANIVYGLIGVVVGIGVGVLVAGAVKPH